MERGAFYTVVFDIRWHFEPTSPAQEAEMRIKVYAKNGESAVAIATDRLRVMARTAEITGVRDLEKRP